MYLFVKRLLMNNVSVILHYENEYYDDIVINELTNFSIVGVVVGKMTFEI